MIDIEESERRAVTAMMGRNELPAPDAATRAALIAAGVVLGPQAPASRLVDATLPAGWRKERAEVDRAFWILDARGIRRFRAWWKAPHPFAFEPGYGGIAVVEQGDDYARSWSADDSFEVIAKRERQFRIECPRCRRRVDWTLSMVVEQDVPGMRARVEQMSERAFAHEHSKCEADKPAPGEERSGT